MLVDKRKFEAENRIFYILPPQEPIARMNDDAAL